MTYLVFVALLVALAWWSERNALKIIAGVITVAFGVYWVNANYTGWFDVVLMLACVGVGLYTVYEAAIDTIRRGL